LDLIKSILVVDDSHMIRAQVRVALEAKGLRVLEAENGQEGLWRARENSVDLVLTDVHMPVMDGLRMVQELRRIPAYSLTPILMLTSDAARTRIEEGRKVGVSAWLLKPLNAELLSQAIDKILFGVATRGPTPKPPAQQVGRGEK
jgi:two-component system, chemotaxis family, chemotaxis protein CheY